MHEFLFRLAQFFKLKAETMIKNLQVRLILWCRHMVHEDHGERWRKRERWREKGRKSGHEIEMG